ncbi:Immunoglobulin [Sergentomyia squamirostris]
MHRLYILNFLHLLITIATMMMHSTVANHQDDDTQSHGHGDSSQMTRSKQEDMEVPQFNLPENTSTIDWISTEATETLPTISVAAFVTTDVSTVPSTQSSTTTTTKTTPAMKPSARNRTIPPHHRHHPVTNSSGMVNSSKNALGPPFKPDHPINNFIFDSHSSATGKHHHHNDRYGPHFEDIKTVGNVTNITVQIGSSVYLNCRISLLQDKTVSWVRRRLEVGEDGMELLTVGHHTYSGDLRYTVDFQYPSNWRLKISPTQKIDEGTYECQISTHPPRVIQVNLHINAPEVMIIDEMGAPLQDKYYEVDSTIQLSCIVRAMRISSSFTSVFWTHGDRILNYDVTRGGISVKTDLMEGGANSTLFVARVNKSDSGNYTCSISSAQFYTVTVHVLNESYAELHHGSATTSLPQWKFIGSVCFIVCLLTSLWRPLGDGDIPAALLQSRINR